MTRSPFEFAAAAAFALAGALVIAAAAPGAVPSEDLSGTGLTAEEAGAAVPTLAVFTTAPAPVSALRFPKPCATRAVCVAAPSGAVGTTSWHSPIRPWAAGEPDRSPTSRPARLWSARAR